MRKAAKRCFLVVVLGVLAVATLDAQQNTPTLTPQDYIEIQQLVARYPYTLDGGLERGKAFADLFSDDGEFHQQTGRVWIGRKELLTIADRGVETPNALGHFAMNHVIDATPTGAVGKQYLVTIAAFGEEKDGRRASTVTPYHYEDVYVKTSAGWRFKSRTVVERAATAPGQGRGSRTSQEGAGTGSPR